MITQMIARVSQIDRARTTILRGKIDRVRAKMFARARAAKLRDYHEPPQSRAKSEITLTRDLATFCVFPKATS